MVDKQIISGEQVGITTKVLFEHEMRHRFRIYNSNK